MDPVVQRAGKFGLQLYVKLPDAAQRSVILHSLLRKTAVPVDTTVDLEVMAERCENLTGADLKALVAEVTLEAHEDAATATIKMTHFDHAFRRIHRRNPLRDEQIREGVERYEKFQGAN